MRFSSAFQPRAVRPQPAPERQPVQAEQTPPRTAAPAPGEELPEDLDARVRLIGEWQLGEAC
jgi:hypothetical protein